EAMVSTYIWVDTIASSDGVRKVCCPDGYFATHGQAPPTFVDAKTASLYVLGPGFLGRGLGVPGAFFQCLWICRRAA
ncbi:MAG: hypothetical protein EOO38_10145, partial [Cytophagaceae bacterium]